MNVSKLINYLTDVLKCPMYYHMLLATEGGSEHPTDVPLVVRPLQWFFSLLERGFFHFVPCIPLFWVLSFIYDRHIKNLVFEKKKIQHFQK
jgi:hypothetical protein